MYHLKNLFFVFALSILSFQLSAHGYWIELEGNKKAGKQVSVKMYFGDYPVGERLSGKTLDKMKDINVYVITPDGEKQPIAMTQTNDCWQGSFTPATKGTYEVIGMNNEREVQDWTKHHLGITRPIQYLKVVYDAGKPSEKKSSLYIDAQTKKAGKNNFEITLLKEGKAMAGQKFVIAEFDKGDTELTTNDEGKATFKAAAAGLYILSVDWIDATPGSFKGKNYETVRHRLDVSVEN